MPPLAAPESATTQVEMARSSAPVAMGSIRRGPTSDHGPGPITHPFRRPIANLKLAAACEPSVRATNAFDPEQPAQPEIACHFARPQVMSAPPTGWFRPPTSDSVHSVHRYGGTPPIIADLRTKCSSTIHSQHSRLVEVARSNGLG